MAPKHHLYVAGDPGQSAFMEALVAALRRRGWRVFDAVADVAPGDDAGARRARAAEHSAWRVLVRAPGGGDAAVRAEALAALDERGRDPHGVRVIPVHRGRVAALDRRYSDLGLLQAIQAGTGDPAAAAEEVVRAIERVAEAKGLRQWGVTRGTVAIVAHQRELSEAARAVEQMITGLRSQVERVKIVDLADVDAVSEAEGHTLRVVLVGASVAGEAGAGRVEALCQDAERTVTACQKSLSMDEIEAWFDDMVPRRRAVKALPARVEIDDWSSAPRLLRDPVATKLDALLPKPEGGAVVLHEWERRYLASIVSAAGLPSRKSRATASAAAMRAWA